MGDTRGEKLKGENRRRGSDVEVDGEELRSWPVWAGVYVLSRSG